MNYYTRLTRSLVDKGELIPARSLLQDFINNYDLDWYTSIYDYEQRHFDEFQKTGSVKGITDLTAVQITWDFDSEDIEAARQDALSLIKRLTSDNISQEKIKIAFSGNKGFEVTIFLNQRVDVKQYKHIWLRLAEGLETNDPRVSNPSRIFRVLGTKHNVSGLYKTALPYEVLEDSSIQEIKELAKSNHNKYTDYDYKWAPVDLPSGYLTNEVKDDPFEQTKTPQKSLDFSNKPKFLSNCRWALQNGFFEEGSRNSAFLCLASTYKNLGFDLEHVYRMLKGVAELQARQNDCDRYSDAELYNNIVMEVFGPGWKGGQFTCREKDNWLHKYCQALGDHRCDHKAEDDLKPKKFIDINGSFKDYVMNIDKNTIYTGLKSIDKNVFLSTGCNLGIIGAAGSGKTSIGLEILNNTSKAGVVSVCASLDMAKNRFFEKILYRVSGLNRQDLYRAFQEGNEGPILDKLKEEFGNVYFFKKSCPTTEDLKEYILKVQDETGQKVKLLVTDYFERLVSDLSDDTASSKRIAGEQQDLVDDLDICNITLYQPNKAALAGGPDTPIYDYTKIKGSSFVYQACRIIMSCWRPFYTPKNFVDDKYMQMAVLKNDLGELCEMEFGWNGPRGTIRELEDFEHDELRQMLKEKEAGVEDDDPFK